MKKGTKLVLVLASILLLLGIVVCIAAFAMGANPIQLFNDGTYTISINRLDDLDDIFDIEEYFDDDRRNNPSERPGNFGGSVAGEDNNYSVNAEIDSIDIDWVSGNVRIVRGEGDNISFSETSPSGISENNRLSYSVEGGALKIACCKSDVITIGIDLNTGCRDKELIISVPHSLNKLSVNVTSADIEIDDVDISGYFYVHSTSGFMKARNMNCANVELYSTSGELEFAGVCEQFSAESTSGNIVFDGECKDFETDATSGDMDAFFIKFPRGLSAESVSGNVSLTFPEDSSFELEYETTSGSMDCEFPVKMREDEYIIGNGGAEISVDTTSGNLKIYSE